jgi:hypothetical protein
MFRADTASSISGKDESVRLPVRGIEQFVNSRPGSNISDLIRLFECCNISFLHFVPWPPPFLQLAKNGQHGVNFAEKLPADRGKTGATI